MSAAPSDATDSRLRIRKWISTLPSSDLSLHHRSSSTSSSIIRADSPLLGFTSQENASHDPLCRPSPNYIRQLPEGVQPGKLDKSLPEMRVPSVVAEEPELDILQPSLTRNRVFLSEMRYPTHLSFIHPRPTLPRQPSLPVMRTTVPPSPCSRQTFDSTLPARVRSQSIMTAHRPNLSILQPPVIPPSPTRIVQPPPAENASPDLQRRKLKALVIASGLADEEELRADGLASDPNPQGESAQDNENMSMETSSPSRQTSTSHNEFPSTMTTVSSDPLFTIDPISPRTSSSSDDLDEFDEDASYYGKEMDPLFSPYSSEPPREASKWSLSSSVEMDLQSRRHSTSKSPKGKFKSFISRFSSSSQSSGGDKHVLSFATGGQEKQAHCQNSHADILEVAAGRSSLSSQLQATTYGSWESVPATPTTSMSASTGFSLVTPNDKNESNDTASPRHRSSDERLSIGKSVARTSIESPLTRDTSSSSLTWSGNNTSIPNSPVETTILPLKTSISAANLRVSGLKGLVSRPGPSTTDSAIGQSHSEKKGSKDNGAPLPVQAPRTFRERMMLKNNGSTLSLILGKGGNKTAKSKRKLLISGVEPGNYRRYEAISSWASAR